MKSELQPCVTQIKASNNKHYYVLDFKYVAGTYFQKNLKLHKISILRDTLNEINECILSDDCENAEVPPESLQHDFFFIKSLLMKKLTLTSLTKPVRYIVDLSGEFCQFWVSTINLVILQLSEEFEEPNFVSSNSIASSLMTELILLMSHLLCSHRKLGKGTDELIDVADDCIEKFHKLLDRAKNDIQKQIVLFNILSHIRKINTTNQQDVIANLCIKTVTSLGANICFDDYKNLIPISISYLENDAIHHMPQQLKVDTDTKLPDHQLCLRRAAHQGKFCYVTILMKQHDIDFHSETVSKPKRNALELAMLGWCQLLLAPQSDMRKKMTTNYKEIVALLVTKKLRYRLDDIEFDALVKEPYKNDPDVGEFITQIDFLKKYAIQLTMKGTPSSNANPSGKTSQQQKEVVTLIQKTPDSSGMVDVPLQVQNANSPESSDPTVVVTTIPVNLDSITSISKNSKQSNKPKQNQKHKQKKYKKVKQPISSNESTYVDVKGTDALDQGIGIVLSNQSANGMTPISTKDANSITQSSVEVPKDPSPDSITPMLEIKPAEIKSPQAKKQSNSARKSQLNAEANRQKKLQIAQEQAQQKQQKEEANKKLKDQEAQKHREKVLQEKLQLEEINKQQRESQALKDPLAKDSSSASEVSHHTQDIKPVPTPSMQMPSPPFQSHSPMQQNMESTTKDLKKHSLFSPAKEVAEPMIHHWEAHGIKVQTVVERVDLKLETTTYNEQSLLTEAQSEKLKKMWMTFPSDMRSLLDNLIKMVPGIVILIKGGLVSKALYDIDYLDYDIDITVPDDRIDQVYEIMDEFHRKESRVNMKNEILLAHGKLYTFNASGNTFDINLNKSSRRQQLFNSYANIKAIYYDPFHQTLYDMGGALEGIHQKRFIPLVSSDNPMSIIKCITTIAKLAQKNVVWKMHLEDREKMQSVASEAAKQVEAQQRIKLILKEFSKYLNLSIDFKVNYLQSMNLFNNECKTLLDMDDQQFNLFLHLLNAIIQPGMKNCLPVINKIDKLVRGDSSLEIQLFKDKYDVDALLEQLKVNKLNIGVPFSFIIQKPIQSISIKM